MSRLRLKGQVDLLIVAVLALAAGAVASTLHASPPRIVAGALLVLVLPGYALSALVFDRHRIGGAALALSTLGTSLAICALGGLLLDGLPGHMGRAEWAILLALLTVVATVCAAVWPPQVRSGEEDEDDETGGRPALDGATRVSRARLIGGCALGVTAAALAVGAIALARHAAEKAPGFSELSALPLSSARDPRMSIEVKSHEHRTEPFALTVHEDGRTARTTVTAHLLIHPGQEWRMLTRPVAATTRRLVVDLDRAGSATPYLHTVFYPPGPRAASVAKRHAGKHRARRAGHTIGSGA